MTPLRPNRRLTMALAALALAAVPACDQDSEPDDGASMDLMGDGDFMGDRDLQWQSVGDVPIEGTEHLGMVEVESMSHSKARVKSERLVLGPLGTRIVEAVIQPVGFESNREHDMAFAVFMREGPDQRWRSYSIPGTVGDFHVDARMFRSIRINRELNSIELNVVLPGPDGVWNDHFAKVVRLPPQGEVGLAPSPVASWEDLEGMWEYELEVRCGGGAC